MTLGSAVSFAATSPKVQSASQAQKQISATAKAKQTVQYKTPKQQLTAQYQKVSGKIDFTRQRVLQSSHLNKTEQAKAKLALDTRLQWVSDVEKSLANLDTAAKQRSAQAKLVVIRNNLNDRNFVNKKYQRTRVTGQMKQAELIVFGQQILADIGAEIATISAKYNTVVAAGPVIDRTFTDLGKTRTKQAQTKSAIDKVKNTSADKSNEVFDAKGAIRSTENSLKKTNQGINDIYKSLR